MKNKQKKIIGLVLSFAILFGTVGNAVISYASESSSTNYYEDITDFIDDKIRLINLYKSRLPSHYAERILGLNKYRTLTSYFFNSEKFVEAYFIESVKNYMENDKMKIFKKIFSITNEYSNHKKHKVITFFNLKFKFRVKEKRNAQNACGCRERESNPSNCL